MMRHIAIGLAAVVVAACRTHQVDDCLPECDAEDQAYFAECVAYGSEDGCQAGNRRCCALETGCLGPLDDQLVVSRNPDCQSAMETECWPPCDPMHDVIFESCLVGGTVCPAGDDVCCALAADCLGVLGDVVISAEGCCSGSDECGSGEICSQETWECTAGSGCGDGTTQAGEECDDGNDLTEACFYGESSCVVCGEGCRFTEGATSFCGDGIVDPELETCDPPGTACDDTCQETLPDTCTNGSRDVGETDIDCGGTLCPPCSPDSSCLLDRDCALLFPECPGMAVCFPSAGICGEVYDCEDGDSCTVDHCEPGVGCLSAPIDNDGDGHGPASLGCGRDCDDFDRGLTPDNLRDDVCDGLDQDCDRLIDEDC